MIPYFVVLFVSGASAALAFRTPDKRNSTLFSLVAILAPCLLAAFRDPTVGVDVLTYAEPSFYSAISRNIWEYIASSDNEPLFSLLAYVSANVFQSSFVYYFLIELLVVAPVYKAIKDNCPRSLRFLAWLVFYFTLFGFSFNLMRQSIAVAILLAGFSYLSKKSYFKYCLVVIVACGFHYSSLMGFVVLALYVLFDSKKLSLLKKIVCAMAFILMLVFAVDLINFALPFKSSYSYQLHHMVGAEPWDVFQGIIERLIIFFPLFCMVFLNYDRLKDTVSHFDFCLMVIFAYVVLYQLGTISSQLFRLSLVFYALLILVIPLLIDGLNSRIDRSVYSIVIAAFLFSYFIYFMNTNGQVVPYTSDVLGISSLT